MDGLDYPPTAEQQAALDMFSFGDNLAIEAGAGTGKTSTLLLIAGSCPERRGQYMAFNRSIVDEAASRFPSNVAANTAHSLAMRTVGRRYAHRLRSARQRGSEVARILGLGPLVVSYGQERKVLQPDYLASLVMRTVNIFCQTADDTPGRRHVPYIEGIDPPAGGERGMANNNRVRDHIAGAVQAAWADLSRIDGTLRFTHAHYLKLWQLSHPMLPVEFVLFDEAQDASPVMLDVVARQTHAQLVFVGDSQQQIYEFTGAVNALAKVPAGQRTLLTQSFRFGPAIAARANDVLAYIGADLTLVGSPSIASTVGPLERPACILTRTNATAVDTVLDAQKRGETVHLIGGGTEVVAFAEAAADLMEGRGTWHPELACFTTWGEVQAYVEQDPQGSELALLVGLVDRYGVPTILAALRSMAAEEVATLIVSTAHKAKGREWPSVQLSDDFPDPRQSFDALMNPAAADSELRLLYVAITRAQQRLDVSACEFFQPVPPPVEPLAPDSSR